MARKGFPRPSSPALGFGHGVEIAVEHGARRHGQREHHNTGEGRGWAHRERTSSTLARVFVAWSIAHCGSSAASTGSMVEMSRNALSRKSTIIADADTTGPGTA